jgi:hypothetical protein
VVDRQDGWGWVIYESPQLLCLVPSSARSKQGWMPDHRFLVADTKPRQKDMEARLSKFAEHQAAEEPQTPFGFSAWEGKLRFRDDLQLCGGSECELSYS